MRGFCMWIGRVVMMVMIVFMMVVVVIMMVLRNQTAHAGAECITQRTVSHIRPRCIGTLPFDVVMVAFLHGTDLALKSQNLHTVLA